MDTWGTGSFENDAAAAFVKEVIEDGQVALEEAFDVALDPDISELEAEEGARAVAAAETLQAHLSGDSEPISDQGLREWLGDLLPEELSELRPLAVEALERVLGPDSELPASWEAAQDTREWRQGVERLQAALRAD
ncbi:DUF4259 domain-containing protein [Deinococcus sp.]|uniref:DUF4259 domain-containing protein n=1 Tax=Deinococcus sp. TaxID=47478 RepID=UPI003CC58635